MNLDVRFEYIKTTTSEHYPLVQTGQANDREPWAYLKQVLTELPPATRLAQIEVLLPWATR